MKGKRSKVWVVVVAIGCIFVVVAATVASDATDKIEELKKERMEALRKKGETDLGILPAGVPKERWIAINENAGYAITSEDTASVVDAALYLKTERGWRHVRVLNPAAPDLLRP